VLALVAVFGAPLFLREPRWGLVVLPAIALLLPIEFGTGTEVSLNSAVFAIPAVAGVSLAVALQRRDIRLARSRLYRPLLSFSLIAIVSLIRGNVGWNPAVPTPANLVTVQLAQLSIYALSFASFWLTANVARDLVWLRRVAYGFVVICGAAVGLLFLSVLVPGLRGLFLRGSLPALAPIWLVSLSMAFFLADRQLGPWQRLALLGLSIGALLWFWFFQRAWLGAGIAELVAIGTILWWHSPRSRVMLVSAAGLSMLAIGLPTILRAINWDLEWQSSVTSRFALWRSVVELGSQSPFLGLGLAAYRHYHHWKPITLRHITWIHPNVSAHNLFVDLFAQMGLLGLACYVWFLVEATLLAKRLHAQSVGFARAYALAALGGIAGGVAVDMVAATSLPFVYNVGFWGLRASILGWMLLGGLVILENARSAPPDPDAV
jgi:O-antigen ligase